MRFLGKNKQEQPAHDRDESPLLAESTFITARDAGTYADVVILSEKVTERESAVILPEVSEVAAKKNNKVSIDCGHVMMLASAGIGALVQLNKVCKAGGGKLVIHSIDAPILEMLKLTHMHKLFTIADDAAEAAKALK